MDRYNGSGIETVEYVFNGANQIQCVDTDSSGACNGTEFEWVYDAMLLKTQTTGSTTTTYGYNSDGDRISQAVGSTTTTYTLDIGTPLTLVIAETPGSSSIYYWHGLGLVA